MGMYRCGYTACVSANNKDDAVVAIIEIAVSNNIVRSKLAKEAGSKVQEDLYLSKVEALNTAIEIIRNTKKW